MTFGRLGGINMDRLIEIKLPKCTVFLSAGEINSLLIKDPELWKTAILRGKSILRARQAKARNTKTYIKKKG